ncbi:hypothetical protein OG226_50880 [Streptomyces sp. NBC_01261]|nr:MULTISPECIES: hypothetical protein [unclassified Streptomyces]
MFFGFFGPAIRRGAAQWVRLRDTGTGPQADSHGDCHAVALADRAVR